MASKTINEEEAASIALRALGWILSDEARASRLLALTGMEVDDLRSRLGEPALLAAVLQFLEQHQPDLLGCAEAIGEDPARLIQARLVLEPEAME